MPEDFDRLWNSAAPAEDDKTTPMAASGDTAFDALWGAAPEAPAAGSGLLGKLAEWFPGVEPELQHGPLSPHPKLRRAQITARAFEESDRAQRIKEQAAREAWAETFAALAALPVAAGTTIPAMIGLGALGGGMSAATYAAIAGKPIVPQTIAGTLGGGISGPILNKVMGAVVGRLGVRQAQRLIAAEMPRVRQAQAAAMERSLMNREAVQVEAQALAAAEAQAAEAGREAARRRVTEEIGERMFPGRKLPAPVAPRQVLGMPERGPGGVAPMPHELPGPMPSEPYLPRPGISPDFRPEPALHGRELPRIPEPQPEASRIEPAGRELGPPGWQARVPPGTEAGGIERFESRLPASQPVSESSAVPVSAATAPTAPMVPPVMPVSPPKSPRGVIRRLMATAEKAGAGEREGRLQVASAFIGREVKSFNELTVDEAHRLTKHFADLADPARAPAVIAEAIPTVRARMQAQMDAAPENVGGILQDAALTLDKLITSGESFFRKLGPSGNHLADLSVQARTNTLGRIARESIPLEKASNQFTQTERELISDVMQGAPAPSARIQAAADELSATLAVYADEAEKVGLPVLSPSTGKIHPFKRLMMYFPRFRTEHSIRRYAPKPEQAMLLRQFRRLPPKVRAGNAQFAREMDDLPGYERDAFKAVAMYIDRTAPRIEQAKLFGGSDELAKQLMAEIDQTHGRQSREMAEKLWSAWAHPAGREHSPFAYTLTSLASPLFLTHGGILQPTQVFLNTTAREGVMNTTRAIATWATRPAAREASQMAGVAIRSAADDMIHSGAVGRRWSQFIGLTPLDRINREVSGIAAMFRANDVVKELSRGKMTPKNLIDARRLGLDIETLAANGYKLTPEMTNEAMLRGSVSTQFLSDALSTPLARQGGWGRVIYLYKNYAMNQARLVKDLCKDAKAGHWAPLVRFMGSLGTAGVAWSEGIRALRQKEAPEEWYWRLTEDLSMIGTLGLFGDTLTAISRSPEAILSFIAGPIVSEGARTASEISQAAQGETDPLVRHALQRTIRRVPFVGEAAYQELAP